MRFVLEKLLNMYFKPTTYLLSIKSPKSKIVNITAIFDALKVEWYGI